MKTLKILLITLIFCTNANAETKSYASDVDNRIRFFDYDQDEVFVIDLQPELGTLLLFDPNETVTDISIDDADGFRMQPTTGKNGLFLEYTKIKRTRMTVLTDQRTYAFIINGTFKTENRETYSQIRFNYSDKKNKNLIQTAPTTTDRRSQRLTTSDNTGFGAAVRPTTSYDVNIDYNWKGDPELLPKAVFDNGLFTFFEFKGEVPAIFEVTKNGFEQVVNRHQDGDLIVVQKTAKQYTLRIGEAWVCIFNMHAYNEEKKNKHVNGWQNETIIN